MIFMKECGMKIRSMVTENTSCRMVRNIKESGRITKGVGLARVKNQMG